MGSAGVRLLAALALAGASALPVATRAGEPPRYLNLDFESPSFPRDWYTGSEGYAVDLDSIHPYWGRQCLRIRYLHPGRVGIATQSISVESVAGRTLRLEGFVRTEGVAAGWAGLWCRVDGVDRMLAYGTSRNQSVHGTSPWTRHALEIPVDSSATNVDFGFLMTGEGSAWFDHLGIWIDGVPYAEPPAPTLFDPTGADLDWLRRHAAPFATDDPAHPCDDLLPVLRMIGNSRLVGLGEGTHGTREFARVKHRLLRCMAEELGYTLLAVEANAPETARLNHYIVTGEGDPRTLLRELRSWNWNTEEILDLVRWMRAHNASGGAPLRVLGVDLQLPALAVDSLAGFLHAVAPPDERPLLDSLRLIARTHEADGRAPPGGASGTLDVAACAGHRLGLRGYVRTEEVASGSAGLWIRAEGDSGASALEAVSDPGISGTTAWRACSTALDVPPRARRITVGVLLAGSGTAWFD
jgi:erythromycin esterase